MDGPLPPVNKINAATYRTGHVRAWKKDLQCTLPPGTEQALSAIPMKIASDLMVRAVKLEYLHAVLKPAKAYTWPVHLQDPSDEVMLSNRSSASDAAGLRSNDATGFRCAVAVDLQVAKKVHVHTERWLQVQGFAFAASLQHCKLRDPPTPGKPVKAILDGFTEVVDILELAPWHLLRLSLCEWTVHCINDSPVIELRESKLLADAEWDIFNDDTPALLVVETLQKEGWRFVGTRSLPLLLTPEKTLHDSSLHPVEALLPVLPSDRTADVARPQSLTA